MTPLSDLAADWQHISRLLDDALARPATERDAWLASQSDLPLPVRQVVQQMLAREGSLETAGFLATLPPLQRLPADLGPGLAAGVGIGPWRLISELGQGGMGSVWLAERADGSLKRRVALKLPHMAWAPGQSERMAREREILSTLEHPHIARLYDAGVDQLGRPWLALEHVQGRAIDVYCRDEALTVAQRVQLLLQVCAAVAYAHGRLVIHRDLKPGNILVGDDGQVRLLDFGIAKLLDGDVASETALTRVSGRALTLDYASPEQVRGEPLMTTSDVYSLGVVAYELLTGARPYLLKRGSAAELEQAIEQADIEPASRAATDAASRAALRGDLDAVLHKALQKDPGQRYAGVDSLAEDLRAFAEGRAVRARPDSPLQRTARLLRRHRQAAAAAAIIAVAFALAIGVGATTLIIVALSVGMGAAWWQAAQARQGRREAEAATARATAAAEAAAREAARAGAIGQFMVRVFGSATDKQVDPQAARQRTAAELLKQGAAEIETLRASHPQAHAQLLRTLGELHLEMHLYDAAKELFERAFEGSLDAFGEEHVETQWARIRLAGFLIGTARGAEARALVERAVEVLRRTAPRSEALAEALSELCSQFLQRESDRAIAAGREALALMEVLPRSPTGYRELLAQQRLGRAYRYVDDVDEASQCLDRVAAGYTALFGPDSRHATEAARDQAHLLFIAGRYDEAVVAWRTVLARFEAQPDTSVDSLCESLRGLSAAHQALGELAQALDTLERVIALLDAGPAPRLGDGQRWLTLAERAHVLLAMGEPAAALALADSVRGALPQDLVAVRVHTQRTIFEALCWQGQHAELVDLERELLSLLAVRRGTTFQRQAVLAQLAAGAAVRGEVALARDRLAQADAALSPRAPARRCAFVTAVAHARVESALGPGGRHEALQRLAAEWLPVLSYVPRDLPRLLQCELALALVAAAPAHPHAAETLAAAIRHLQATQARTGPMRLRAEALAQGRGEPSTSAIR